MYKLMLCLRYLRTRYIALASIISVTLGVATMIVVNSVMAGFTEEMQERIHGILSDVVVESNTMDGFQDPQRHMEYIRSVAGEYIEGMTATIHTPAMLSFEYGGEWILRPIQLIGIDAETCGLAGDYGRYLQHPANRQQLSFELRDGGYDVRPPEAAPEAPDRPQLENAGWPVRRRMAELKEWQAELDREQQRQDEALIAASQSAVTAPAADSSHAEPPLTEAAAAADPFAERAGDEPTIDLAREQYTGVILGIGLASYRGHDGADRFLTLPGEDVRLSFPTAGTPPRAIDDIFTIVDFYECKMSEYDATFVLAPIEKIQELRGMGDAATAIQIKLKDEAFGPLVRDRLRQAFAPQTYAIHTWRDKQGTLLAAVQMEAAILNVLLFLIIAVAGFGILAIFYMIVVEKTRDIGVLKSLGATGRGVMGIFMAYGLSLGVVGSGAGMVLGLLFVAYINQIADGLGWLTGQAVFDPSIYYFYAIPTKVSPFTVSWIVLGALGIAVSASVLPARRAARLNPVEALRYE